MLKTSTFDIQYSAKGCIQINEMKLVGLIHTSNTFRAVFRDQNLGGEIYKYSEMGYTAAHTVYPLLLKSPLTIF